MHSECILPRMLSLRLSLSSLNSMLTTLLCIIIYVYTIPNRETIAKNFLKIGVSLDPTMWWTCKKGRFQGGYYVYVYIDIRILYGCLRWTIPKKWDTQWLDTYRMAHTQMTHPTGERMQLKLQRHSAKHASCHEWCQSQKANPVSMHHLGHLPAENLTLW